MPGKPRVLLVIAGGIAAYKALDLIRRLRERGLAVRAVMTRGAQEFVTPLAVGALTGGKVFTDLFDREDEHDVGHIRLAREADLVVVAPATADLMAKMAGGHADDLATAVLLATASAGPARAGDEPGDVGAPRDAAQRRDARADGVALHRARTGRDGRGGEAGLGRMAEPLAIVAAAMALLGPAPAERHRSARRPACRWSPPGRRVEPIDPVRYIANRSSGKQGHAIAAAARRGRGAGDAGQRPGRRPRSAGRRGRPCRDGARHAGGGRGGAAGRRRGDGRRGRRLAAGEARPRQDQEGRQRQGRRRCNWSRTPTSSPPSAATARSGRALVVGFAAETADLIAQCPRQAEGQGRRLDRRQRRLAKARASWAATDNTVSLVTAAGVEPWPTMTKAEVAARLVDRIADALLEPERGRRVSEVTVLVRRLPHGEGLPAPLPKSTLAAGADLPAAVAPGETLTLAPGGPGAGADRLRARHSGRLRGPGAAALGARRQPWRHRPQCARHDRRRLSRRGEGDPRQPRRPSRSPSRRGMRIAQLVIAPVTAAAFVEAAELPETERGSGGFGSTGRLGLAVEPQQVVPVEGESGDRRP